MEPKAKGRTGARIEIKESRRKGKLEHRYTVYGRNGRVSGASEEGFKNAKYAIGRATKEHPGLPVWRQKGRTWTLVKAAAMIPEREPAASPAPEPAAEVEHSQAGEGAADEAEEADVQW